MSEGKSSDHIGGTNFMQGSSHHNPAPVGVTIKTTVERGDAYFTPRLYELAITLLEVVRGKDAVERIKAQGISDKPPETGFEYILARINCGYFYKVRGFDDEYRLTEGQFVAVSADGRTEYEIPSILQQPQPQIIGWVFHPGESREGWIIFKVPEDDKRPLLVFKREHVEGVYGRWRYVWFQLY